MFQVRDLMSHVFAQGEGEPPCISTVDECPDKKLPCAGQSGCPQPSQKPPKTAREMLDALRDQIRQALLPA